MASIRQKKPRLTILAKLMLAFVVPTLVFFAVFAVVAHEVARRDLEAELGTRLAAIASSAATQVRGKYLVELQPGDEAERAYLNTQRKLAAVAAATGVERIYVFDQGFRSRNDTASLPIGDKYFQAELDRHEVMRVFSRGEAVSSILFEGKDGKKYKAGYAPVYLSESDTQIVLALGVEAPATYFTRLSDLRSSLLLYGGILAFVVVAMTVLVATIITRPVRSLASVADRIGKGQLDEPVVRRSRDEIGLLADTMERMRRDLKSRDERMQMMLAGIAHEVRNPLGGMELFAGILRDELDSDDERYKHVLRIEKELLYLKAVVNDFLEYARRPKLETSEVDLIALTGDIAELAAKNGAVTVHNETGDHRALCMADAGQLRRVFLNLVQNGQQASEESGGAVQIRIARGQDGWTVSVCNEGEPIPEDVQRRMFEPFFTTREKGTGLGLAFVEQIIVQHGGQIQVHSGEAGTRFEMEIPRTAPTKKPEGHQGTEIRL